MNPHESPLAYDYVVMNGIQSPGLCEIVGAGSPRNWDERKGYGLSGATLVFTGNGLSKFSVKIRIGYEGNGLPNVAGQWAQWDTFREIVQKAPKGTRPKAIDIYHPFLEELEIKAAVVLDCTQWLQVGDGVFEKEIKLQAFSAPKPASATPEGSGPTTPKDPVDQMIDGLTDQLSELAK